MSRSWSPRRLGSGLMDRRLVYAVGALVLALVAAVLVRCSADDESGDDTAAKVRLTPITAFEASSVTLLRQEFCGAVPEAAITATVGEVRSVDSYRDGEAHRITDRVNDVAHEWSCAWTGTRGDVARAWIFAPRVTVAQARELVAGAERRRGCRTIDSHDFGTPSTGVLCKVRGGREASYRGLFVDTWLACSLTDRRRKLPEQQLVSRAGSWCVQAALAAS